MSILNQIPKPSFIFDPTMANESRGALAQVRRVENETGQESDAFTRNSVKYVQNKAGVLVEVPENVPAVEFDKGFSRGYLAEIEGANIIQRSDNFAHSIWSKVSAGQGSQPIVTSNYAVSPNGKMEADRVQFNLNGGTDLSDQSKLIQSGTIVAPNTFSVWIKSNDANDYTLRLNVGGSGNLIIVTPQWQRFTFTTNSIENSSVRVGLRGVTGISDTADVLLWGAQRETGTVATSYIPTEGSTASRGADNLIFEDAEELIGQDSGVVLVSIDIREIIVFQASSIIDFNNQLRLQKRSGTQQEIQISGNSFITSTTPTEFYNKGTFNFLIKYSDSEATLFFEGENVITSARLNNESLHTIRIGHRSDGRHLNDHIRKAYLWNNADWLTDELAERLTS